MINPNQIRLQWIKPLIFASLCLSMLALLVFGSISPAAGANPQLNTAQWTIEFDFTNGQMDATLFVQIGYVDQSGDFVEMQNHREYLDCSKIGTFHHSGDWVEFDGSNYLKCELPDISDLVSEQTGGELSLSPTCDCKHGWAGGDIAIDPHSPLSEAGRTIYYHPDMQLYSQVKSKNTAQYLWKVDSGLSWSSDFPIYSHKPAPMFASLLESKQNYDPTFSHNGFPLKGFGTGLTNTTLTISTGATTIYLGHEPGGDNFMGRISTLKIDPPCFGGGI